MLNTLVWLNSIVIMESSEGFFLQYKQNYGFWNCFYYRVAPLWRLLGVVNMTIPRIRWLGTPMRDFLN